MMILLLLLLLLLKHNDNDNNHTTTTNNNNKNNIIHILTSYYHYLRSRKQRDRPEVPSYSSTLTHSRRMPGLLEGRVVLIAIIFRVLQYVINVLLICCFFSELFYSYSTTYTIISNSVINTDIDINIYIYIYIVLLLIYSYYYIYSYY